MQIRRPDDIGAAVRDARTRQSMTQTDLAARIEVNREWVSRLESGEPGVSLGLVLRALNEVGLTLSLPDPTVSPNDQPDAITPPTQRPSAAPRPFSIDDIVDE